MARGRKSAAARTARPSLAVVQAPAPEPPAGLPPAAADLWRATLADLPSTHLRAADLPLLEAYCRSLANVAECDALIAAEGLIVDGKRHPAVGIRDAELKSARACAEKLRLCPSSRMRADAAALRKPSRGSAPWET